MKTKQPYTPIAKTLARFMPSAIAPVALTLIYAFLIMGIVLTISFVPQDMIYMDVPAAAAQTNNSR